MSSMPAALTWAILAASLAQTADKSDLERIERRIKKEPSYTTARPLYGLLALGPRARSTIWLVLDKSKADAERYDILYVDLNSNGDISESNERFIGQMNGDSIRFELPDLQEPVSGIRHTKFRLKVSGKTSVTVMVGLNWRDGFAMGGGYPEEGNGRYLEFAEKPALAP